MAERAKQDKSAPKKTDPQADWQYQDDTPAPAGNTRFSEIDPVSWTASEYIEHEKSAGWFVRYVLAVIVLVSLIFLLTREWFSVILTFALAVVFGIFAARKPTVLQYHLDNRGVVIGQKLYPISLFRSFAVVDEGAFHSIILLPMKRFMPSISIYYAPDDEAAILNAFSLLLPQETHQHDAIDRLMHRIRF